MRNPTALSGTIVGVGIILAAIFTLGCQNVPKAPVSSAAIADRIKAPHALEFRGETYRPGHSAADGDKMMVEYYRRGDGPKSWEKLLAVRLDSAGKDGRQQVQIMQQTLKARGTDAVRAYQTTNGPGIEFILTTPGRQELNVFRFSDRTNGLVSLQYAESFSTARLKNLDAVKMRAFYVTLRSNAVWALESIEIPQIEKR